VSVTPSPFALPLDVRKASAEREEVSMGFAPFGVMDNHGNEYTLGAETNFFDTDGVKGKDIILSLYRGKYREDDRAGVEYGLLLWLLCFIFEQGRSALTRHPKLPKRPRTVWPEPAEAFYFVDWFDQCEQLFSLPLAP
jgi:hypothetical protein